MKSRSTINILIIIFLLFSGCGRRGGTGPERIQKFWEGSSEESGSFFIDGKKIKYSNIDHSSFPLNKYGKSLEIENKQRENNRCWLVIYSKHPGSLNIKSSGSVLNKTLSPGFNEISFDIGFRKKAVLTVKKRHSVWFSNPVIYRSAGEKKNVFLIIADTLGAGHLSVYNPDKNISPEIKKFSGDSTLFLNSFSSSSYTPSAHMSMFTSLYEQDHGIGVSRSYNKGVPENNNREIFPLGNEIPVLIENLGKKFVNISYNGSGNVGPGFGFFRGFDLWRGSPDDQTDPEAGRNLFRLALKNLDSHQFDNAFYFLHTFQVHTPYIPEDKFITEIDKVKFKEYDFKDIGRAKGIYGSLGREKTENIEVLYESEIRSFDHFFGKFIRSLKERGIYKSSMIILTSDHGEAFFRKGIWSHASSLYNDQIRIPLIIKFPEDKYRGRRVKEFVSIIDIIPTIMDYYGIEKPAHAEGRSLIGILENNEKIERTLFSSLYVCKPYAMVPKKAAVIFSGHKLIYNEPFPEYSEVFFTSPLPKLKEFELYDIINDPEEKHDLFGIKSEIKDLILKKMIKYIKVLKKGAGVRKRGIRMTEKDKEQLKTLGYID